MSSSAAGGKSSKRSRSDVALEKDEWVCTAGVTTTGSKVVWLARVQHFDTASGEATLQHFIPVNTVKEGVIYRHKPADTPWIEHCASLSALPPEGMRYLESAHSWVCTIDLDALLARVDAEAIEYAKEQRAAEGACL
jgi:hypothetical protein